MQSFQQQYPREVITGSFEDLNVIICTNKNNNNINTYMYLLQNQANIKE